MGQILSSLLEIFYTKKLDIVVIGLENRYVHCICHALTAFRRLVISYLYSPLACIIVIDE